MSALSSLGGVYRAEPQSTTIGGLGERCELPISGVWGEAPADNEFCGFKVSKMSSGENDYLLSFEYKISGVNAWCVLCRQWWTG